MDSAIITDLAVATRAFSTFIVTSGVFSALGVALFLATALFLASTLVLRLAAVLVLSVALFLFGRAEQFDDLQAATVDALELHAEEHGGNV